MLAAKLNSPKHCDHENMSKSSNGGIESSGKENSVSDDEEDKRSIREAYEEMYNECIRLHKMNKRLTSKNENLEKEREDRRIKFEELKKYHEILRSNLNEKVDTLEQLKGYSERLFTKLSIIENEENMAKGKLSEALSSDRGINVAHSSL